MNPAPKQPDQSTYSGRFAARLRSLREKRKLTVQEAAAMVRNAGHELTDRAYYNWESGKYAPPINVLPALSTTLGVKTVGNLFPPN